MAMNYLLTLGSVKHHLCWPNLFFFLFVFFKHIVKTLAGKTGLKNYIYKTLLKVFVYSAKT